MKAVIKLDVPSWQIGEPVLVYFPDTMLKKSVCEESAPQAVLNERKHSHLLNVFVGNCPSCKEKISTQKEKAVRFCKYCGQEIFWKNEGTV